MPESINVTAGVVFPNAEREALKAAQRIEKIFSNVKFGKSPLGSISADFNKFNDSLESANARVLAFSASAGGLFLVEKAFASLIKTTINVEKELTDINVLLGANQANLKQFSNSIFQIAKDTGQGFSQVAEAAKEFSRQGLGATETLKRTKDALILTRLTGLDAKSAMEDLTAAVNTFNKAGLDTTTVINKFANVDAAFAVSAADLAEAIKRTGSSAADAGVDIDELIALVTSLQQTTSRGGAVIGTAIKSIFGRIEKPEILEQLEQLGIQVKEAGQNLSAIKVLENLAKGYDNLSDSGKSFINTQVGTLYQINLLKAGLSDLSKENSVYNQALLKSRTATDEAISRNEELNQTLSAQINILRENARQAANNVGEGAINPALKGGVGILNNLLGSFNQSIDSKGIGGQIGKGLIEGIGQFISGPGAAIIFTVLGRLAIRAVQDVSTALTAVIGTKQQQLLLEEQIARILAAEPALIALAKTGAEGQLATEREILSILKQKAVIQGEYIALSSKLAGAVGAAGISIDPKTKNIKVPGFANPLHEAISREVSAAGVSPSQVKVGTNSQLISNFNPLGLGVYNTVDEPSGLGQGIARAKMEGRNPKTYGIPGFAAKDPFFNQPNLFGQIRLQDPDFDKRMAAAVREGTELGNKELAEKMAKTLGIFFGDKIKNFIEKDPLRKILKPEVGQGSIIPSSPALNTLLNPTFPLKTKSTVGAGTSVQSNILNNAFGGSFSFQNPTLSSSTLIPGGRLASQFNFDQSAQDKFFAGKLRTTNPNASLYSNGFNSSGSGPFVIPRNEELNKLLEEQKKVTKAIESNKGGSIGGLLPSGNTALAISFLAPLIGGILKQAIGNETRGQRGAGAAVEAATTTASFAATGLFLGGSRFGPTGALIGGGLGLLTTLPETIKAFTSVLPELQKQFEQTKQQVTETTDNLTQFVSVTEQLKAITLGQVSVDPATYSNLRKQESEVTAKLQASNPEALKRLFDAQDGGNVAQTAGTIKQELQQNENFKKVQIQLQSLLEKQSHFYDLFGSDTGLINTKLKTGTKLSTQYIGDPAFGQEKIESLQDVFTNIQKLKPESQQSVDSLANFLQGSKVINGKTIPELIDEVKFGQTDSYIQQTSQDIEPKLKLLKEYVNKDIPNLSQKEKTALSDSVGFILQTLEVFFSESEKATRLLEDIDKDPNLAKRTLITERLASKTLPSSETIEKQAQRRAEAANFQKQDFSSSKSIINDLNDKLRSEQLGISRGRLSTDRGNNIVQNQIEREIAERGLQNEFQSNFVSPRQNVLNRNNLDIQREKLLSGFRTDNISVAASEEKRQTRFDLKDQAIKSLESIIAPGQLLTLEGKQARKQRIENFGSQFDKDSSSIPALENRLKELRIQESKFDSAHKNDIDAKEIETQIKAYEEAITKLNSIQDKANSEILKENENLSSNIKKFGKELEFGLKLTKEFSDERAIRRSGNLNNQIKNEGTDFDIAKGSREAFFNEWEYSIETLYRDLKDGAADLSKTIKTSFGDTFKSIIIEGKNAGDAFKGFLVGILNKITSQSIDRTSDLLFSGLGKLAGGNFGGNSLGFSSGGPVVGGSGTKDDVPALLQGGEYVLRKAAVQNIGVENLKHLNAGGYLKRYAVGGNVSSFGPLLNTYKDGNFLIDPRLSSEALDDPNNPQNNLRSALEDESLRRAEYERAKKKALSDFESQRRTAAGFALLSAGIQVGGAAYAGKFSSISTSASSLSNNAFRNTYQGTPPQFRMAANGGSMEGGDSIPALLTKGEFVVKKDIVNRMGKPYFDKLNRGVARFAEGGIVGNGLTNTVTTRDNNFDKLILSLDNLSKTFTEKGTNSSGTQETGINITINMTDNSVTSEKTQNEKTTNQEKSQTDNKKNGENLKQVADLIKSEVTKILINEKRAGGLLSTTPR